MMTLHRSAGLEVGTGAETEAGIVRLSFASEAAVLREDPELGRYYEVLSHAPGDAVLGFLNRSGVLLEGHDERKPITPEKQIAAALLFHRCARHATPENVAAVEAELAVDRRREENAAKRDLLAQATVIAQLQGLRLAS